MKVNAGFLISYDYEFLKTSIPLVYKEADSITLAIDSSGLTWSGNPFHVEDSFFEWLKHIDKDRKIKIFKEEFYLSELTAMENETRERNLLAKEMGEGWNLQIDADEYFIDFKGLVEYLKVNRKLQKPRVQVCPYWIPLIKKLDNGILYISKPDRFYLGSNQPDYVRGRKNRDQMRVYVPFLVLHQSFARDYEDLKFKVNNWGHNKDFDINQFLESWKQLDESNYKSYKNFHPYDSKAWPTLDFCAGETMEEVMENLKNSRLSADYTKMFFKNIAQNIKHFRF